MSATYLDQFIHHWGTLILFGHSAAPVYDLINTPVVFAGLRTNDSAYISLNFALCRLGRFCVTPLSKAPGGLKVDIEWFVRCRAGC